MPLQIVFEVAFRPPHPLLGHTQEVAQVAEVAFGYNFSFVSALSFEAQTMDCRVQAGA